MAVTTVAFSAYPVTDLARADAFYSDALGLAKGEIANDAWIEYEIAGTTFGVGNFPQLGQAGTAQSLALEVADLDGFRAQLAAKGHPASEPFDLPICRIAVVKDPDGNQVFLHEAKPR